MRWTLVACRWSANGVDPAMRPFRDLIDWRGFANRHAFPERFILFLGTLQPRKNLITLLRAWAQLDAADRLPLVVVGSQGWMYEPIYDEARSLGVAGEIIFKGFAEPVDLPIGTTRRRSSYTRRCTRVWHAGTGGHGLRYARDYRQ